MLMQRLGIWAEALLGHWGGGRSREIGSVFQEIKQMPLDIPFQWWELQGHCGPACSPPASSCIFFPLNSQEHKPSVGGMTVEKPNYSYFLFKS